MSNKYYKKKKWKKKYKKRNRIERFLDRYNHIMEFMRTLLAITTIILQLYIISKLTGG